MTAMQEIMTEGFQETLRGIWSYTDNFDSEKKRLKVLQAVVESLGLAENHNQKFEPTESMMLSVWNYMNGSECACEQCRGNFLYFGIPGLVWFQPVSLWKNETTPYDKWLSSALVYRDTNAETLLHLEFTTLANLQLRHEFSIHNVPKKWSDWPEHMPKVLIEDDGEDKSRFGMTEHRWMDMQATFVRWGILPKE